MNPNILTLEDLKVCTGYDRPGDIEKHLRDKGIHCFRSSKGIWTTVAMVNAAGGILPNQSDRNEDLL